MHTLRLALRYLLFHRVRSLLLVSSVALVLLLPILVERLLDTYERSLAARAAATPLVVGALGSRYDLVLNTLYFRGRIPRRLPMAAAEEVQDSGLADAIPLLTGSTAQGFPIVATSADYYAFRKLAAAAGELPALLGDAVLGASVAAELGLRPGDAILSDRGSLYDLTMAYPLRMRISGVLRRTGGPDDRAVFTTLRTGWVLLGIGHGHLSAEEQDEDNVLRREEDDVVLNAAVFEYQEITEENAADFHFHGDPATFPLTAVIAVPRDKKSATILKGRYRVSEDAQALVPSEVVDELLSLVFKVKRFFDANFVLVSVSTSLLLGLIAALTLRVRQREMETLFRIGCARGTVARLFAVELLILVGLGAALAAASGAALARLAAHLVLGPA